MYFVYILYSKKYNKTYVGATNSVERRIEEHNSGKSNFTKKYQPWHLVQKEEFETKIEAFLKEKYYKSSSGRQLLKSIIESFKNEN